MKYLIITLLSLLLPAFLPGNEITLSASSGQGDYRPEYALDNDMGTRWSSEFSDDQWLRIDFETTRTITGLRLHWETAYGRDYAVQTLSGGNEWKNIAMVTEGDGGQDEIYFGPRRLKSLRIKGIKRGTGWGYSLWEVDIFGEESEREFSASSSAENSLPEKVMDGSIRTAWKPAGKTDHWIVIEFPVNYSFGGMKLAWTESGSPECEIQVPEKDHEWKTIHHKPPGGPSEEDIFFDRTESRKIRLFFPGSQQFSLGEITLKGPDETWNPVRHFEMLAQRMPDGAFPGWLRREQIFWTVTGLPQDQEESLLDEHGRVEPFTKSFSVTPLVSANNKILAAKLFNLEQSLYDGWIPIPEVTWTGDKFNLKVTSLTVEPGVTITRYDLEKQDPGEEASLILAIRPLQINPPWQHGGFSPINDARFISGGSGLVINGRFAMKTSLTPDFKNLIGVDEKDISERLVHETKSRETMIAGNGVLSAGMRFDLPAGRKQLSLIVSFPLDDGINELESLDDDSFDNARQECAGMWEKRINGWKIEVPDDRLSEIIRSNLAYLLINADGPAIQPGSRNYQHSWIRDGAVSATALLRFGQVEQVEKYIDWFSELVSEDGFVPFIVNVRTGVPPGWAGDWKEYDSFGEYVFAVRQYVEFTGDREKLRKAWPEIIAALEKAKSLRRERMTEQYENTPYYGILPESNSHEGYFPAKHSYWDDFWAIKGFHDGAVLAGYLGRPGEAKWMKKEAAALEKSLVDSMKKVMQRDDLDTLPACVELGDFDPTSTAIGIMAADQRNNLPPEALVNTFEKYYEGCVDRMKEKSGAQYTPYEVRNISALIRLGEKEKAWKLLDWFLQDAVRPFQWNHMAEVVHDDPRTPSYIGDMPHTWVGAGLINAIRDIFVYEERGKLVLANGIPDHWLKERIKVRNLPTWWGSVSYDLYRNDEGEAVIELQSKNSPPAGFSVPDGFAIEK
mgnify:CR=1 FL=1